MWPSKAGWKDVSNKQDMNRRLTTVWLQEAGSQDLLVHLHGVSSAFERSLFAMTAAVMKVRAWAKHSSIWPRFPQEMHLPEAPKPRC